MPVKKSKPKLPRFNQFSVGKTALLFNYGLQPHKVADRMYKRYGKQWKIGSPEQMHEYLFTVQRGRRPNPERMFAGKSKAEIKAIYKEWLKKARDQSSRMRKLNADPEFAERHRKAAAERMRKLNADPEFARKQAERMRKLNADPKFAERNRKASAERMRKLHADPEFAERHRKAAAEKMRKLHTDPKFAERNRKAAAEKMRKLHTDPKFAERNRKAAAEKMRKLWQNPEWRKIQRRLISSALTKYWDTIRTGLRDEFRIRGLLRDVEFEEDKRGKSRPTSILVSTRTPAREAEQTERKKFVLSALSALKPIEREAISTIFFEGRTHEEAAAMLGVDIQKIKGLLQSAYKKMAPKVRPLL